jgi:radical SAM superfamily enzyme YgiQ (UPF0313 family)
MITSALLPRHEVHIADFLRPNDLSKIIREFAPQACGISCSFTVDEPQTLQIARFVKSMLLKLFVFVGGHHASLNPKDFAIPAIDALVVGEGEETTAELMAAIEEGQDLLDVPGLICNREEYQITTKPRDLIANLDTLPLPARQMTKRWRNNYFMGLLRPTASIETARGCPFRCNFCSVWYFFRGKCRFKSAERVVNEIEKVEEQHIFFTDDNFLSNVNRAKTISHLIRERGIRKTYSIQARTDTIARYPEVITDWKEVGLDGVFIGLEKIDAIGMAKVAKANSVENNEIAMHVLKQNQVGVMGSLIVDPDWNIEDFTRLRNYVRHHKIDTPTFTVLTPLPGTPLFEQQKDRLTTNKYELFDLMHAVVPTRLELPTFYREFAKLYSSCYSLRHMAFMALQGIVTGMSGHHTSPGHLWRIARSTRFFNDSAAFLAAHTQDDCEGLEAPVNNRTRQTKTQT